MWCQFSLVESFPSFLSFQLSVSPHHRGTIFGKVLLAFFLFWPHSNTLPEGLTSFCFGNGPLKASQFLQVDSARQTLPRLILYIQPTVTGQFNSPQFSPGQSPVVCPPTHTKEISSSNMNLIVQQSCFKSLYHLQNEILIPTIRKASDLTSTYFPSHVPSYVLLKNCISFLMAPCTPLLGEPCHSCSTHQSGCSGKLFILQDPHQRNLPHPSSRGSQFST